MSLLGIAALAGVAYAICKGGEGFEQQAYRNLNKEEFDAENARYGITYKLSNKKTRNERIRKHAARHGVRYKDSRFKILPDLHHHQDHYVSKYVEKYALRQSDISQFYKAWNEYNKDMKKHRDKVLRDLGEEKYKFAEERYRKLAKKGIGVFENGKSVHRYYNKTFVLDFYQWPNIDNIECKRRLQKIKEETYLKEVTIEQPIIRGKDFSGWHITWTMRAPDKDIAFKDYKACCEKFGWNTKIIK